MADFARVTDPKTGCRLKLKKAIRLYEQGVIDWIVEHVSYRRLTLAEMVERRSEITKRKEGLVYWVEGKDGKLIARPYLAELHQCHVEWSTVPQQTLARQGYAQIKAANQFCAEHGTF